MERRLAKLVALAVALALTGPSSIAGAKKKKKSARPDTATVTTKAQAEPSDSTAAAQPGSDAAPTPSAAAPAGGQPTAAPDAATKSSESQLTATHAVPGAPGDAAADPAADPAPSPRDRELPRASETETMDAAEIERVQHESRALRDEIFKARARVALLGANLFQSSLDLEFKSNLARFYQISDFTVTLDGAPVYVQASGVPPTAALMTVFAAPGSHEIGVFARMVARRDPTYSFTLADTFTVVVPPQHTVFTRLGIRETGNMWRFAGKRRAHARIVASVKVRAKPKASAGARGKTRARREEARP